MFFKKQTAIIFIYLLLFSCTPDNSTSGPEVFTPNIVILYTNDEHGWMEASDNSAGAAAMMGLWKEKEGYDADSAFIILSGGDNWTGPAISTWFKGESMVELMNTMHYTASAIGNHEFDFTVDGLITNEKRADFPYLSANIREKASGEVPEFATPYIIREVNGVKLGIIGLSSVTTPWSTFPKFVEDYDFIDYATALNEYIPKAKTDGAELIIIAGHICYGEMQALLPVAKELGVAVIGGGHCHEPHAEVNNNIAIIEGGSFMQGYAKVNIRYDLKKKRILDMSAGAFLNDGGSADPEVQSVVMKWQGKMDSSLTAVIGYTDASIGRGSNEMFNMITDSWLITIPSADVALTNRGGIRQDIPAGDITLATIVGVLPFENAIVEIELNGQQLIDNIKNDIVVGGMTTIGGYHLSDGRIISADSVYHVLTTDYLYYRSDYDFQFIDSDPYFTSIHYRQPVIDRIKSLHTSPANPLNNYLNGEARQ